MLQWQQRHLTVTTKVSYSKRNACCNDNKGILQWKQCVLQEKKRYLTVNTMHAAVTITASYNERNAFCRRRKSILQWTQCMLHCPRTDITVDEIGHYSGHNACCRSNKGILQWKRCVLQEKKRHLTAATMRSAQDERARPEVCVNGVAKSLKKFPFYRGNRSKAG